MTGLGRGGYVLAGGLSSRMGRDKALLPLDGVTLVERVAGCVLLAAGTVTIVGPPERYRTLELRVIPDDIEKRGPLGGVLTALRDTTADWNIIAACDMPAVRSEFFEDLFTAAEGSTADCVVPQTAAGFDPLCAIYHRRCAAAAISALDRNIFKMQEFISSLRILAFPVSDAAMLENVNTPAQWSSR